MQSRRTHGRPYDGDVTDSDFAAVVGVEPAPRPRVVRGSRLDSWWRRVTVSPIVRKVYRYALPTIVMLVAILTRFTGLGEPRVIMFDETYYVKDAWSQWNLGYAATWPTGADEKFNAGQVDIFTTDPAFVVHPQLGKWISGLFMALVGPNWAFGWRLGVALAGVLAVVLIMLVAQRLFHSWLLTGIAGFLLAIDGQAIVMSRIALLDNYVMFFALLGFYLLLVDRSWTEVRVAAWVKRRTDAGRSIDWGPALWWRPWMILAGAALGATAAVKWNGLYFLAVWALYTVVSDMLMRRRYGIHFWSTSTIVKQAPVTFLLMVPIALAVYLTTWLSWFTSDNSYDRHWAEAPANAATGFWSWVPTSVQSFWHYEQSVYDYNIGEARPHPYQANPLTWLFLVRPTSMYYQPYSIGQHGCTAQDTCAAAVSDLANPLIWWAGTAAFFALIALFLLQRQWQMGAILAGMAAGYLPWLMYTHRTVFQFYTIAFEPYLLLGLVCVIGIILGTRRDPRPRRVRGLVAVGVFLVLATGLTVFFLPMWTAQVVPYDYLRLHWWFPSWI